MVGCWRGYLSGARCRLAYGPADAKKRAVKQVCVLVTFLFFETPGFASESNIEVGFSKFMKPISDAQIKQTVSLKLVLMPVLVLTDHKHC